MGNIHRCCHGNRIVAHSYCNCCNGLCSKPCHCKYDSRSTYFTKHDTHVLFACYFWPLQCIMQQLLLTVDHNCLVRFWWFLLLVVNTDFAGVDEYIVLGDLEQENNQGKKKKKKSGRKKNNNAASRVRTCAGRPHWISSPTP